MELLNFKEIFKSKNQTFQTVPYYGFPIVTKQDRIVVEGGKIRFCGKQHVTKSLVICSNKKFGPKIKMARNEKLDKYLLFRLNVISLFIGVQSYGQEDPT